MAVFTGDKGTVFELEFRDYEEVNGTLQDQGPLDITSATEIIFYYKDPAGAVITKKMTAGEISLSNGGADGKARHVAETGFLNLAGSWERQGWVRLSSGGEHFSEVVVFAVKKPLI